MTAAERKAASSGNAIQRSLTGIKVGLAGLTAGISLGAIVAAGKRALDYAASLAEVSQQLGVTTRDLQVYRYIASQVGISEEEMDKGLAKLTLSMGKAREGSAPLVKAFKELSDIIGRDILKSANTAGDAIPLIADAMAKIVDPTRRAQLEMVLFGKTGQKFDTLLAGGSAAIYELAKAAEELGIVLSDEQIQSADKTADKLDAMKRVLEARIAGVIADNADAILQLVDALAQLVTWATKAANAWAYFQARYDKQLGEMQAVSGLTQGIKVEGVLRAQNAQRRINALDRAGQLELGREWTPSLFGPKRPKLGTGGGGAGAGTGAGGGRSRKRGGGGAGDAERKRKDALRDEYDYQNQLRRFQMDELRLRQDLTEDYSARADLAIQILDLERQQSQAANAQDVAMGDLTEAKATELNLAYDRNDAMEREKVKREEQARRAEEFQAVEDERFDNRIEGLQHDRDMAQTASEQRDIEMRILKATYDHEKLKLQLLLAEAQRLDDAQAAAAAERGLADLNAKQKRLVEGVMDRTKGPLDQFLDTLPDSAAKANEALERVAAEGLQSVVDGLTDAITGAKSLGEVFKNVAKQIIADLVRIGIQKALTAAMGGGSGGGGLGSLFGGSGGTLSKSAGSGGTGALKGFARGGAFMVAGRAGTDRNVLSVNGMAVARVGHGERISINPDNDNGGRIAHIVPSRYFDVVVDGRVVRTAGPMAQGAAVAGSADARSKLNRQRSRQFP